MTAPYMETCFPNKLTHRKPPLTSKQQNIDHRGSWQLSTPLLTGSIWPCTTLKLKSTWKISPHPSGPKNQHFFVKSRRDEKWTHIATAPRVFLSRGSGRLADRSQGHVTGLWLLFLPSPVINNLFERADTKRQEWKVGTTHLPEEFFLGCLSIVP